MVLSQVEGIMRKMLSDTILALCRNTLPYSGEFSVEGLLGITLDKKEIFLININETIHKEGHVTHKKRQRIDDASSNNDDSSSRENDDDSQDSSRRKRKRKRKRKSDKSKDELNSDLEKEELQVDEQTDNNDSADVSNNHLDNHSLHHVKQECDADNQYNNDEDNEDLVFIKEEPKDASESGSYSFPVAGGGGQYGMSDTDGLGHLQELALQLSSSDMSSSPLVNPANMVRY